MSRIIIIMTFFDFILCIWPPPYDVVLQHEETFIIDEHLEKEDIKDVYDEEIVGGNDRQQLMVQSNDEKFYRLHNSFRLASGNIKKIKFDRKREVFEESYPKYYDEPSGTDFLDDKGNSMLHKREENSNQTKDDLYDYNDFKAEFDQNLQKKVKLNQSLVYVETNTISASKGFLKNLITTSENVTMNCSVPEKIGIGYVKCLISDLNKSSMKTKALDKLIRFMLAFLFVYLVIVLPLWCQYGWCCCCCICKFCRPLEEIDEVKSFFANNPLGVYHDQDGQKYEFNPSVYEKYANKKLSKALQSL